MEVFVPQHFHFARGEKTRKVRRQRKKRLPQDTSSQINLNFHLLCSSARNLVMYIRTITVSFIKSRNINYGWRRMESEQSQLHDDKDCFKNTQQQPSLHVWRNYFETRHDVERIFRHFPCHWEPLKWNKEEMVKMAQLLIKLWLLRKKLCAGESVLSHRESIPLASIMVLWSEINSSQRANSAQQARFRDFLSRQNVKSSRATTFLSVSLLSCGKVKSVLRESIINSKQVIYFDLCAHNFIAWVLLFLSCDVSVVGENSEKN